MKAGAGAVGNPTEGADAELTFQPVGAAGNGRELAPDVRATDSLARGVGDVASAVVRKLVSVTNAVDASVISS